MTVEYFNNKGFTLIEMLLALSVFSTIVFFLIHTIPLLRLYHFNDSVTEQMTWELFLQQTKLEVMQSEQIIVFEDKVKLVKDGRQIQYEPYGNVLRRRVDRKGHEVILNHVQNFLVHEIEGGMKIYIEFESGAKMEAEIHSPASILGQES